MSSITVFYRDGTKTEFPHVGRAGGSWTKTLKMKEGFAIIQDEWGKRIVIPADHIHHIEEQPNT